MFSILFPSYRTKWFWISSNALLIIKVFIDSLFHFISSYSKSNWHPFFKHFQLFRFELNTYQVHSHDLVLANRSNGLRDRSFSAELSQLNCSHFDVVSRYFSLHLLPLITPLIGVVVLAPLPFSKMVLRRHCRFCANSQVSLNGVISHQQLMLLSYIEMMEINV